MIPRKLARHLLRDYVGIAERRRGDDPAPAVLDLIQETLSTSEWVLRGAENVEQKARRYLMEGRLVVEKVLPTGLVVASCRGSSGEVYRLGYDPAKREWRCTCPVMQKGRCSHVIALQLVTVRPA